MYSFKLEMSSLKGMFLNGMVFLRNFLFKKMAVPPGPCPQFHSGLAAGRINLLRWNRDAPDWSRRRGKITFHFPLKGHCKHLQGNIFFMQIY